MFSSSPVTDPWELVRLPESTDHRIKTDAVDNRDTYILNLLWVSHEGRQTTPLHAVSLPGRLICLLAWALMPSDCSGCSAAPGETTGAGSPASTACFGAEISLSCSQSPVHCGDLVSCSEKQPAMLSWTVLVATRTREVL